MRRAVPLADHDVGMHRRLPLVDRHVPEEREHLDLFLEDGLVVLFPVWVEEAQSDVAERPDGRQTRGREVRLLRKRPQAGHDLVAWVEDERERAFPLMLLDQL